MFKFEDDFESGNISKWTPSSSTNWQVVDDAGDKSLYIATTTPEKLMVNRTYTVMSFDVDIKGYGTSSYRNISIVFGYKDANNYYHMNFCGNASNASYNGIFKVVNGTETRIATAAALLTDATQYHHVRVTWNGTTGDIKVYFDQSNTPVVSINDKTQTSGQVGLWSKARQGYFDNVEVVARIRTDSFGSTAIRNPQSTIRNNILQPDIYIGPNPLYLGFGPAFLKGTRIFGMSGQELTFNHINYNGIYIIKGNDFLRKITVIK
jgi:hypothetical protein